MHEVRIINCGREDVFPHGEPSPVKRVVCVAKLPLTVFGDWIQSDELRIGRIEGTSTGLEEFATCVEVPWMATRRIY